MKGILYGNLIAIIILFFQNKFEIIKLNPESYFVKKLPFEFPLEKIIQVNILSLILIQFALIIPLLIITRLKPTKNSLYKMKYFENITELIGNTPLVKLNKVNESEALVLAKVETFNPGHSIKDRMALKMIKDAEKKGLLKPNGTIIEGTSGNTGMGLASSYSKRLQMYFCTSR